MGTNSRCSIQVHRLTGLVTNATRMWGSALHVAPRANPKPSTSARSSGLPPAAYILSRGPRDLRWYRWFRRLGPELLLMTGLGVPAIDPSLLVHPSPSGLADSTSPPPSVVGVKRSTPDNAVIPPRKGRRSTEEEKQARLVARQERNRQSAHISREKKKVYVEQLELEVKQLREESTQNRLREERMRLERQQLEQKVDNLGSKLHSLEQILGTMLKTRGDAGAKETAAPTGATPPAKEDGDSARAKPVPRHSADISMMSAAPAAVSMQALNESPLAPQSPDSTRLPAAEATDRSVVPARSARQWVPSRRVEKGPVVSPYSRPAGPMRRPMAAASSQTTAGMLWKQACAVRTPHSAVRWRVSPTPSSRGTMTLLCILQVPRRSGSPTTLRLQLVVPRRHSLLKELNHRPS